MLRNGFKRTSHLLDQLRSSTLTSHQLSNLIPKRCVLSRRQIHYTNKLLGAHQGRQLYQKLALHQSDLPRNVRRPLLRYCKKLFCKEAPKGFGNFYKKGAKKATAKSTEDSSSSSKPSDAKPKPSTAEQTTEEDTSKTAEEHNATVEEATKSNSSTDGDGKDNKDGKDGKDKVKNKLFEHPLQFGLLVFASVLMLLSLADSRPKGEEISFQQFKTHLLETGRVERIIVVNKQEARVFLRPASHQSGEGDDYEYKGSGQRLRYPSDKIYTFQIGSVDAFETKLEQAHINMGIDPNDWVPVSYQSEIRWADMILKSPILYFILFGAVMYALSRRAQDMMKNPPGGGGMNNMFSMGKANVTIINKGEKVKTKFSDVAGLGSAKEEVMEFVKFLKNPKQYTKLGANIPKGALLVGPPGTGKTLLAKATAGEADCPFFSISGSDFIEMFVGVGPSRVRDLFQQARANAPCIVFIDEIDAVGRKRGKGGFGGGNDERENTLNQLLVEMDGFTTTSNVVVLAGTNRADILDSALIRPGRFDRQIQVDKPDIKGRIEIFMVHLRDKKLALPPEDVAQRMATLTPGMAGADIANICNEAALRAARLEHPAVRMKDFYYANDRVIAGLEKRIVMTVKEKSLIAHHEAGHAVCGWFLEHADPLLKVTVIPRAGGALGFAQYLPKELQLYDKDQIYDMICMALGGRAAEEIFFGKVSTGAADDLKKVTGLAYGQVQIYGMSDVIGNVSFQQEEGQMHKPYSEYTAQIIDSEVKKIVDSAYVRTLALLREKKDDVAKLAQQLLDVENLDHDSIVEILGPRPFVNDSYQQYMENTSAFLNKHGSDEIEKDEWEAKPESTDKAEDDNATTEADAATEADTEDKTDEADAPPTDKSRP